MTTIRYTSQWTAALLAICCASGALAAGGKPDNEGRGAGGSAHIEGALGVLPNSLRSPARVPDARTEHVLPLRLTQALGARGDEVWRLKKWSQDQTGKRHLRMKQYIGQLEVVGGDLILHADARNGEIQGVDGEFVSSEGLPKAPTIDPVYASDVIATSYGGFKSAAAPTLAYLHSLKGTNHLVWRTIVAYVDDGLQLADEVFVDAVSGEIVERHPLVNEGESRKVYDARNTITLPGTLLVSEGGTTTDTVAQTAFNYLDSTYKYYLSTLLRDSWDGVGGGINASVHFDVRLNNSSWSSHYTDGNSNVYNHMAFGDGDGVNYRSFALGLDVVGHEFTHGVTQAEAGLVYQNESGAMNESMSDVFGAMVERSVRGLSANTWLVGEDVTLPVGGGRYLRSMSHPSIDFYADRIVVATPTKDNDWGGVHSNSGISNLAFYLLTQGGVHPHNRTTFSVTGIGYAQAEKIFYLALRDYLVSTDGFVGARRATAQAARNAYGTSSSAHISTCRAWDAVGAPVDYTQCPTNGATIAAPASISYDGQCANKNLYSMPSVAGATKYELWLSSSGSDFSSAVVAYSGTSSNGSIGAGTTAKYVRGKACNAVGCSIFTTQTVPAPKTTTSNC